MELFGADGRTNDMECDFWAFRPLCHIGDGRKCPSKKWDFNDKYGCILHVEKPKMTWADSKIECEGLAEHARLAEIHDKDFGLWLAKNYGKENPWNRPPSRSLESRATGPWLGGTDRITVS